MTSPQTTSSDIQLRPGEPEVDADAEEDDSVNEVTIENIRPRPQGSSPVYEYSIEEEYFNKKLQEDTENEKYSTDKQKMSYSQVSLKGYTESKFH
ncbi:protein AHNAK2-like [Mauremys mutica]|uniref:protein AHNAK2-like n=1 Tax=Mauremys mutica TaxID=74926 RepID=UPI001D134289|nr:protein AHNAK2-like [Mauremys mutica]